MIGRIVGTIALTAALVAAAWAPASAQTVREAFEDLYVFGECGEPVCLDVAASVHGQHFSALAEQAGTDMIGFVFRSISAGLASVPIPSSSATEVFYFQDGALVSERSSAGPIFLERSQTLGQGNLLLGFNVGRISPSNLRGRSLEDLELNFTHEDVGTAGLGDPDWENDVIRVTTDVSLDLTLFSLFATYGLTNSVDFTAALPIVNSSLSGVSQARIVPFSGATTPHAFLVNGERSLTSTSSSDISSTGIGDVVLRAKANLRQDEALGVGGLVELRLPTGDEDDFHGTGETTLRALAVVSRPFEVVTPHLNGGFTFRSGENSASSVTLRGGFDALLGEAVTGSVEVLGEFLVEEVADDAVTRTEQYQFPVQRTFDVSDIPDIEDHIMDFVAGLKYQASNRFRVVGSVLVPMLDGGVRPDVQWSLGVESVF